jgi:2Fe-2S ferredoxin
MAKITYAHPDGSKDVIDVPNGTSIMQAAMSNGVKGIVAECGGSAMCATCHVYVEPGQMDKLPEINAVEDEMLDSTADERKENSRLSCQLSVTPELDGLIVYLPQRQT